MADLVVGLAKSVVEGALTKAQSAIEEEAKLRQSAQRDLVFITGEFQMMQSFLNVADEERVQNPVVRTWVRQIRELAYDVEDCVEFVVHLDKKSSWWRRLLPSFMAAAALQLDKAVGEIEELKARVEEVSRRNARYSLISDSGSKPVMQQKPSLGAAGGATAFNMLIEARDTSKRQQGLGDLTQFLTKKEDDLQLQVISVWGTGGDLGTTSPIRKAYNDPEICPTFTCRAWVKVMHPFNPHEFIRCLMTQFHANSCKEEKVIIGVEVLRKMKTTQDALLEEFERQIKNKKYLVVLEDVSTFEEWDAIKSFLPDMKNGSWIIVSTPQFEIASLCVGHSYQVLELKQFSAEHSVCAFFKEGSYGVGDKSEVTDRASLSDKKISAEHEVSSIVGLMFSSPGAICGLSSDNKILTSKEKEASDWMKNYPLVGREPEMNELRKYIAKTRFNSYQVSMSVWGIAGVGKSALVRNLYYNRILHKSQFEKYSWVDICHPLNLRDFCRSLLSDFHSESLQAKETAYHRTIGSKNPIQECRELLKQYRCLIVIDDLQYTEEWDLIQDALVSRPSNSVIIVITTEARIATHCADNEELVFNVKGLQADAPFDLFKKKVQGKNKSSSSEDPKGIEPKELILKCGGLPKVIVAIASLLATKTVTRMGTASSINDKFMHQLETNPEFHSLQGLFRWMHSYFRICPDYLKPCIFYLSLFPLDHSIRRRRLVRRWVAEGYSRDSEDKSAEQNGELFFSELLDLSIIQQPPQSVTTALGDTRMVWCQVNGFVREYIVSRRMEENLVFELGGNCTPTTQRTGRHLIIKKNWVTDKIVFESIDFSRLRSLTVFGKWKSFFISKSMKLLRVLDLEDATDIKDEDLEQMVKLLDRLKFLSLRGCREIYHLPSSLGDLRQLQSLDVRHTSIVTLPANITKLQKLQYVRAGISIPAAEPSTPCFSVSRLSKFCRCPRLVGVMVPRGIDKLTALHTLGVVNISASRGKAILKELKDLTQLRKLGVSGINRRNSKKFFSAISGHGHLESLSVQLDKDIQGCLDGISLPSKTLQSLKLYGLIDKLPEWSDQLSKLTKLDLEMATLKQDDIMFLGNLPKLCILRLRVKQLEGGKLHFRVDVNGIESRSYEKVKVLEIACGSNLNVTFGSQTLKSLEVLKADCYNKSSVKFSGLENLTELKEALLKGCCDDKVKEDLRNQLAEHPKKPVLKME